MMFPCSQSELVLCGTTGFLLTAEIPTHAMESAASPGSRTPSCKAASSQHIGRARFRVSSAPFMCLDYGGFLNDGKN